VELRASDGDAGIERKVATSAVSQGCAAAPRTLKPLYVLEILPANDGEDDYILEVYR
jgi:hypothetical protein